MFRGIDAVIVDDFANFSFYGRPYLYETNMDEQHSAAAVAFGWKFTHVSQGFASGCPCAEDGLRGTARRTNTPAARHVLCATRLPPVLPCTTISCCCLLDSEPSSSMLHTYRRSPNFQCGTYAQRGCFVRPMLPAIVFQLSSTFPSEISNTRRF